MKRSYWNATSHMCPYVNYVKEAVFSYVHLGGLVILGILTTWGVLLVPAFFPSVKPGYLIILGGGFELVLLGVISRNLWFIQTVNAKHTKEIDAYHKAVMLVMHYNALSEEAQIRFEDFRRRLNRIWHTINNKQSTFKSSKEKMLLNGHWEKLNSMESSYARLLYFKDRFPKLSGEEIMQKMVMQIDQVRQELKTAKGHIKQVKKKRLKLLQMRLDNYYKVRENIRIVDEQLTALLEMVRFMEERY